MAVRDEDAPLHGELSVPDGRHERSAHQAHTGETGNHLVPGSADVPLHRMHEDRIVRPAGRMLIGSPAPIPTLDEILKETPMFSGRKPRRLGVGGVLTVTLACGLAIGAALALTGVLKKHPKRANRQTIAVAEEQYPAKQTAMSTAQNRAPSEGVPPRTQGAQPSSEPKVAARVDTQAPRMLPETQTGGFSVKNISGFSGEPIHVQITLPRTPPEEYSFVMFRGLPAQVGMSSGFRLKESWVVSLRDLDGLVMQSTPELESRFDLDVSLIKGRDVPAESRSITVDIQRRPARTSAVGQSAQGMAGSGGTQSGGTTVAQQAEAQPPRAENRPQRTTPPAPADSPPAKPAQTGITALPAISAQDEGPLLEKAASLMNANDVASARLLFEHLTRMGSAKAALALGQTYDPAYFNMAEIKGMRPDAHKAKEWYKRASEMGNEEGTRRYRAMEGQ